ncbi:MAG TPA: hypothetical protein VFT49_03700 [Candidatus Saccharimonadales bacterium]|nr:hypothetical protein [Candidatus Saccharimonadales bacterium]
MGRRILAAGLLLVVINFLWLADSTNHVKIGLIWLAVDVALWLPELRELSARL